MIILAIILGVLILALFFLGTYIAERCNCGVNTVIFIGAVIIILLVIELCLVVIIKEKPTPSALDVYQGKTTIEYTIRDGVKVDSIIVFKESYDGSRRTTK